MCAPVPRVPRNSNFHKSYAATRLPGIRFLVNNYKKIASKSFPVSKFYFRVKTYPKVLRQSAEAKVRYLHISICIQKNVLELNHHVVSRIRIFLMLRKTQTVNDFARFIAAAYVYLQISVVNTPTMAITYGVNKLLEIFPRFAFLQMAVTRLHMAGKGD